ncbi:MAG: GTP cyclohydrolase I FolE [Acidobacteria bacterium]|jgi:GTP cyclohydrolase I|nr:MAG: GTP cyclohydrolase I FolE [Acidobacteriota bacterium]GIU81518.1 MAG: GTP cyclohydrolase 1 [Pyrinomonadaceae bacterium]
MSKPVPEKKVDLEKIAQGVRLILEGIGEDPTRDGLRLTPQRVAEFFAELTEGMWEDPAQHIQPLPGDSHDEMVIVKDIPIASVCEHHLAPFVGKCHIAYIPKDGRIVGLSKLARLAETFARRLQVQERLTQQIADTLFQQLKPLGVMVVIEAEHTCMTLRGVRKPGAKTVTSSVLGNFRRDARTRAEAMALIKGKI